MESSGERTFKATSRVLSRVLDGEAVLLDLGGGQYYGLDEVGTVVWTALEAGASVAELVVRVVVAYQVAEETARGDIERLLAELADKGLVTSSPP